MPKRTNPLSNSGSKEISKELDLNSSLTDEEWLFYEPESAPWFAEENLGLFRDEILDARKSSKSAECKPFRDYLKYRLFLNRTLFGQYPLIRNPLLFLFSTYLLRSRWSSSTRTTILASLIQILPKPANGGLREEDETVRNVLNKLRSDGLGEVKYCHLLAKWFELASCREGFYVEESVDDLLFTDSVSNSSKDEPIEFSEKEASFIWRQIRFTHAAQYLFSIWTKFTKAALFPGIFLFLTIFINNLNITPFIPVYVYVILPLLIIIASVVHLRRGSWIGSSEIVSYFLLATLTYLGFFQIVETFLNTVDTLLSGAAVNVLVIILGIMPIPFILPLALRLLSSWKVSLAFILVAAILFFTGVLDPVFSFLMSWYNLFASQFFNATLWTITIVLLASGAISLFVPKLRSFLAHGRTILDLFGYIVVSSLIAPLTGLNQGFLATVFVVFSLFILLLSMYPKSLANPFYSGRFISMWIKWTYLGLGLLLVIGLSYFGDSLVDLFLIQPIIASPIMQALAALFAMRTLLPNIISVVSIVLGPILLFLVGGDAHLDALIDFRHRVRAEARRLASFTARTGGFPRVRVSQEDVFSLDTNLTPILPAPSKRRRNLAAIQRLQTVLAKEEYSQNKLTNDMLDQTVEYVTSRILDLAANMQEDDNVELLIEVLAQIGSPLIPFLRKAIDHDDITVQVQAIKVIGKTRYTKMASLLIAKMCHGAAEVREAAAAALVGMGEGIVLELLAIAKDAGESEWDSIIEILQEIGYQSVSQIIKALNDESVNTRLQALKILYELREEIKVWHFDRLFKEVLAEDKSIQNAAEKLLVGMGDKFVRDLVSKLKTKDAQTLDAVKRILRQIGQTNAPSLVNASIDKKIKNHCDEIELLGEIGGPEVVRAFLDIDQYFNRNERECLLKTLANMDKDAPEFIKYLANDDVNLRKKATNALGAIEGPLALDGLYLALKDESRIVRKTAIEAIERRATKTIGQEAVTSRNQEVNDPNIVAPRTLELYNRALDISREQGDKQTEAALLLDISNLTYTQFEHKGHAISWIDSAIAILESSKISRDRLGRTIDEYQLLRVRLENGSLNPKYWIEKARVFRKRLMKSISPMLVIMVKVSRFIAIIPIALAVFLERKISARSNLVTRRIMAQVDLLTARIQVRLSPLEISNYIERGRIYLWLNKLELAQADFERAIELDYENTESYFMLSHVLARHQNYQEALGALSKSIELSPESEDQYHMRGVINLDLMNYRDALEDLTHFITLQPNHNNARYFRGLVLLVLQDYESALGDFDQVSIGESNMMVQTAFWRGVTFELLQQPGDARNELSRAETLALLMKDNCQKQRTLAKIAILRGNETSGTGIYANIILRECEDLPLLSERRDLRILKQIYPSRTDIHEIASWFEAQLSTHFTTMNRPD